MLDHVFTDAIGALRDAFEDALLERQAGEERFQTDVLAGDISWENSYALPGEGQPPRVCADVSCVWPTWSQAAYLSWYAGESAAEPPRIEIKILLRAQCLAVPPDPGVVLDVLPPSSPDIGRESLARGGPRVESLYADDPDDADATEHAIDVSYEGVYELDEAGLSDGAELDKHFTALGGWIASMLVRLGDLELRYKPALGD
ncbi:MAG: hypothetical protein OXL98_11240 [Acidimicrobiaceae bacterium]|nr:hypothetical protein [Acidimicrobiaceae bacterium]